MKLDRYEVMRREDGSIFRLGQGATSSSYKALDLDLQTPVVLKVVRQDMLEDDTARKRFLREARAAALLRHPNVAQIFRLGEEDGTCFYAREFVEGETLETKVAQDGPMEAVPALEIARQVAEALVAVKKMNLVHREIKPSNLMRTPEGHVKIIDFGLTKSPSAQGEALGLITLSGFVGTPDYASPEQLDEKDLDVTSDIYSLGVTLWFLLTGRPPFRGPMAQVMAKHLQTPPPFDEIATLPNALVSLLAHMLEKDPARRPLSPTHLIEEIDSCMESIKAGGAAPAVAQSVVNKPSLPVPELKKMTAARTPASEERTGGHFLAEMLIGTGIAVAIFWALSRPLPIPQSSPSAIHSTAAAISSNP